MHNDDHRALVEQAARATMARIRHDGEKAPERLKVLFTYLEQHLFERGLDVNQMKRACGKRNNSVSSNFAEVTGQPPHAYIVARRVETATALLRDTDLEIRIIAKLLGFSKHGLLTRNFKACYKITPQAYRLIAQREQQDTPRSPKLPASSRNQEPLIHFSIDSETIEKIKIETLWDTLKGKPWPAQRDMIQNRFSFSTPAFFHFLRKRSIPEGRANRKYGVHLAELALDCLSRTQHVIGGKFFQLRAQGWTWVANARRFADDLNGSEEAFSIAATYLSQQTHESLVTAEYYGMKSALRRWQRRFEDATELHARALPIFQAKGTPKDIAASLIDGVYTRELSGQTENLIPALTEALQLIKSEAPFLEFTACFHLTNAYLRMGKPETAKELLPQLRSLRIQVDNSEGTLCHLQWLEGLVNDELGELTVAENRYQVAQSGFQKLGHRVHAALVSLDWALLRLRQGRVNKVQELTLSVIPVLKDIELHEEAAGALNLLQAVAAKGEISRGLLKIARMQLENYRLERWGRSGQ
ncbi:MAG: helix-turn-helix transcriptional regulator [bacterium]|nr:helix-turn-helix transcriptional regulator [bacterium]